MDKNKLATQIRGRINELKSQQVLLKPFIESDQVLWDSLERSISELHWVLEKIDLEEV